LEGLNCKKKRTDIGPHPQTEHPNLFKGFTPLCQEIWIQIEKLFGGRSGGMGRPARPRRAIARAFAAKAVFNLNITKQLLDRLAVDVVMRRLCGWES
jgi:hypothetical protein